MEIGSIIGTGCRVTLLAGMDLRVLEKANSSHTANLTSSCRASAMAGAASQQQRRIVSWRGRSVPWPHRYLACWTAAASWPRTVPRPACWSPTGWRAPGRRLPVGRTPVHPRRRLRRPGSRRRGAVDPTGAGVAAARRRDACPRRAPVDGQVAAEPRLGFTLRAPIEVLGELPR